MGAVGKVRLLPFPYQCLLLCPLLRVLGVAAPGMTLSETNRVSLLHCPWHKEPLANAGSHVQPQRTS
jgi:hypothetical protein